MWAGQRCLSEHQRLAGISHLASCAVALMTRSSSRGFIKYTIVPLTLKEEKDLGDKEIQSHLFKNPRHCFGDMDLKIRANGIFLNYKSTNKKQSSLGFFCSSSCLPVIHFCYYMGISSKITWNGTLPFL